MGMTEVCASVSGIGSEGPADCHFRPCDVIAEETLSVHASPSTNVSLFHIEMAAMRKCLSLSLSFCLFVCVASRQSSIGQSSQTTAAVELHTMVMMVQLPLSCAIT